MSCYWISWSCRLLVLFENLIQHFSSSWANFEEFPLPHYEILSYDYVLAWAKSPEVHGRLFDWLCRTFLYELILLDLLQAAREGNEKNLSKKDRQTWLKFFLWLHTRPDCNLIGRQFTAHDSNAIPKKRSSMWISMLISESASMKLDKSSIWDE